MHPICLGSQWGASAHLSGILVSVSTSIVSHMWVAYWTGYFWMSVMLHAVVPFFVVSLCLGSTTMAMATMPPVTVVSSGMSSVSLVTVASYMMGLPATLAQYGVVLLPPLTPRCPRGVISLASVPQQQLPSPLTLQTYANYAMGSPQVGFFFRVEAPIILFIICLVSVLVSAFYFQVPCWMK